MDMTQRLKKSETLQVRLPHGTKQGFVERCKTDGRLASDVMRELIEGHLSRPAQALASENAIMIRKRFLYPTLAAAAAVAAFVTLAPVAGQAKPLRQDFQARDIDGSGYLELSEVKAPPEGLVLVARPTSKPPAVVSKRFDGADAAEQSMAYMAVISADQDGDRRLSYLEYHRLMVDSARQNFLNRDTDGDKTLTEAEFTVILLMNADPGERPGAWPGTAAEVAASSALTEQRRTLQARFRSLDRNHDGRIAKAEFVPS